MTTTGKRKVSFVRAIQKTKAQIANEIDLIIGTAHGVPD